MRAFVSTFLFLTMQSCDVTGSGCRGDRNKDHRPRVSCVNQGLTALPGGIEPLTQVLVLTGNRLTSLSWSDYSAFTHLYELDLSHNDITALEPPGPVLENLSVLRLSGNGLIGLGGGVFRCAPSLMEIYLDNNRIRSLHDATFSDLQRLEVINLSGNKLPALPARLLERVSSGDLKTFDLENNSVSLMPDGFFSSKPDLPYVYLSYNPWLCSCSVGYLHSFLNDQEHNVYKHEGPNDIVPGADSVSCAGPPHLSGRPIIKLKEDDFCPPEPLPLPSYPSGDLDMIDVVVPPTYTPSAQLLTRTVIPSVESWTHIWFDFWTNRQAESESKYLLSSTESSSLTSSEHFTQVGTQDSTADTLHMTQSNNAQPQTTSPITDPPEPPTTAPVTARPGHQTPTPSTSDQPSTPEATSTGPPRTRGADARVVDVKMLSWCWWLFAGFVLLCLLSALTCCFLFLWLVKNHLVLYRTLERYTSSRSDNDGVSLRAYRRTESTQRRGEESEDKVTFLALEQIKDTRAVFRSVLYISKEDREPTSEVQTEPNRRDAFTTAAERERGVMFRKTLYRVISAEHTHNRWTEEEEERWDQNTDRRATRYTLILREDTGRPRNVEWLMGEWEMGERGVVYERPCSLIGPEDSTLPFSSSLE